MIKLPDDGILYHGSYTAVSGVIDMATAGNTVTNEMKEATAITVMRCMLVTFSEEKHIPFEQAMLDFSKSRTYEDLFDFDTEIWKEGPDYLRDLYDEERLKFT